MNKNAKIILILSAVLIAVMLAGCVQEISEVETPSPAPQVTPPSPTPTSKGTPSTQSVPSTGMEVNLSISNAPALNETAELTCTITSIYDAYNNTAQIELPAGLVLVSGNLSWTGDIIVPEEEKRKHPRPPLNGSGPEWDRLWEEYEYPKSRVEFSAIVKSVEVGNWTITATAGYNVFTQEGIQYGRLGDSDYIYVAVREDTAWISETLFATEGPAPARQLNGNETQSGTPEIIIYPEEYIIYQDYLKTIGGKPRISDIGTVEATIISITKTEVCPDEIDFASEPTEPIECSIEPYPKDFGIVRIDRIINYTPHSEQNMEPIIEQPSEGKPSEGGETTTTSGYEGPGYSPKPKPPIEYEPLKEGQEVQTLFLLTVSPAKIRYVPINESTGGMESIQLPEGDTQQTVSHQVGPEKKIFKPIPKDGDYFVFPKIGKFPEPGVTEKILHGLEIGSKFRAGIWYDGSLLYVEEYEVIK